MVQISKLTKAELALTGFKNRSIVSRFMKQILNKKGRDFQIDRRSVNNYDDVLYLLRHDNHFCYIKKFQNFVSSFK
jgi:hypothetical protein